MKLQEKIKSWCKDEKFMSFAQERARKEVCEVTEDRRIDPQYEDQDGPDRLAAAGPAAAERR